MVPPPAATDAIRATWLGTELGFWIGPSSSVFELASAARSALDLEPRVPLPDRTVDVDLTSADAPWPALPMLRIPIGVVTQAMLDAPTRNWSPTLAWVSHALAWSSELVAAERCRPSIRPNGLRWEARWRLTTDDETATIVDSLTELAPPALLAASTDDPRSQVAELCNALVDAVVRHSLTDADWRPPLERSRSATVVALRRAATALAGPDAVFLGDSPAHEMAFAEWSTQLSELTNRADGAPDATFVARLTPPLDSKSRYWFLGLEVVGADDSVTPFDEVWAKDAPADDWGGAASLAALRSQLGELVERLCGQFAVFEPLRNEPEPSGIALSPDDVAALMAVDSAVARAGLRVLVPDTLHRASARLTAAASPLDLDRSQDSGGLIAVDWGVALGDINLTDEELQTLADAKADVVALRGSWVHVDRRALRRVLGDRDRRRVEDAELTPSELLQRSVSVLGGPDEHLSAEGWIATLLAGLPDTELEEAVEPAGFDGELRPYQRRALAWLQFLGRLGLGGCLADDMGLGKTPTALAHLLARTLDRLHHDVEPRPHLVVCPVSVIHNWYAEAARFTPELSVFIAHGPTRSQGVELIEQMAKQDVVITTYGTAPRVIDELSAVDWDVVVLDEAQTIKNHTTNAARAMRELGADQLVALTGTPVENRLSELWSILDTLNPGMLGGITWFRSTLANPIEQNSDEHATATLRRITSPFVLRRTKADKNLVPDLPDKIEQIAWATLTVEQAALYRAVVDDFTDQLKTSSGMERRGLVLATLTRLKQVCNHPAHFLGEADLGEGRSGKLERFDELVTAMLDAEERALVFTQYRAMGQLLATHLEDHFGLRAPFLHGGTTATARQRMVEEFQADDGSPIQLVSLRAGGTGLNLTAASRVIHYDRWWNPAVEDQATDRTWRIGQNQTVFVHKLVCQGTLEERIDALLESKRSLADSVVGTGDQWLTELSTDELRELVRLDGASLEVRS